MLALANQLILLSPGAHLETRPDGLWLDAEGLDVSEMARLLLSAQVRLSTITAVARPDDETDLIYHYTAGVEALNIKTTTHNNQIKSITPVTPAASWIEREIHDLYAVEFTGHPNLERLVRPPELPIGFFRNPTVTPGA